MRIHLEVTFVADALTVQARVLDGVLDGGPGDVPPLDAAPRTLRIISPTDNPFPAPPAAEADALPAGAPHGDLCRADTSDDHQTLIEAFFDRRVGNNDLEVLGRYLFETLIGSTLWSTLDAIIKARPGDWLDFVLAFPHDARWLTRLPWELMHGPAGFLAELPRISIVREVVRDGEPKASAAALPDVQRVPRVLFVVGTDLHSDVIKPGAEYLQLVRRLRASDLVLQTRLLVGATPESVQKAVERLRPDVVHFICHGGIDPGTGEPFLDLAVEGKAVAGNGSVPADSHPVTGTQVLQYLHGESDLPLPRIVVLNACYTAGEVDVNDAVAAPLAAQLVGGGVPMVVGMTGPPADQACRLFARQFYISLAQGADIAQATARGRRAALAKSIGNPRTSPDWAYPAIYMRAGLQDARLHVGPDPDDPKLKTWLKLPAMTLFGQRPVFCDRFHVFERFDLLMADTDTQKQLTSDARIVNLMSIDVSACDPPPLGDKFGRTWLLKELADKACVDGHFPILVSRTSAPKTADELIDCIVEEAERVAAALGLADYTFRRLDALGDPAYAAAAPDWIESEISSRWKKRDEPAVLARALRLDLCGLLQQVRKTCCSADHSNHCRLVLLVDDVHRMDEAATFLLNDLLGGVGVLHAKDAAEAVRVVLGWSSKPIPGQVSTVDTIKQWLNDRPAKGKIAIERFTPGLEELLAYQHFILHLDTAAGDTAFRAWVSFEPAHDDAVKLVRDQLHDHLEGVPSRLVTTHKVVRNLMQNKLTRGVFVPADDDTVIAAMLEEKP